MKCSAFKENILRQLDGETLDSARQKEMDEHLAQCESCSQWRRYLKVIEDGREDTEIPSFEMAPRVSLAVREAAIQAESSPRFTFVPSLRLSAAVSMLLMIAFAGIYRFGIYEPSEAMRVEWMQSDGQTYQVISSNRSSALNPDYLRSTATPALQSQSRQQLGFLTDKLALALRSASESSNWEELRQELEEQELDVPNTQPEFLALSGKLTEFLKSDETQDVDIWVIQPADSVLLFTLAEDGK